MKMNPQTINVCILMNGEDTQFQQFIDTLNVNNAMSKLILLSS
jgi:hypothetical protein